MVGRINMPEFRAINKPEIPMEPTSEEQPLFSDTSRQLGKTVGQPSTAGQYAVVIHQPPTARAQSQQKYQENIVQAAAERERAFNMTKRKSRNSTPQPRRKQAPRAKKVVCSVEHSPPKTDGSSTSGGSTDGAGSDYVPPSPDRATGQSSTPSSPPRRSPRKHPLRPSNVCTDSYSGSAPDPSPLQVSPQDVSARESIKQES